MLLAIGATYVNGQPCGKQCLRGRVGGVQIGRYAFRYPKIQRVNPICPYFRTESRRRGRRKDCPGAAAASADCFGKMRLHHFLVRLDAPSDEACHRRRN